MREGVGWGVVYVGVREGGGVRCRSEGGGGVRCRSEGGVGEVVNYFRKTHDDPGTSR